LPRRMAIDLNSILRDGRRNVLGGVIERKINNSKDFSNLRNAPRSRMP